MRTYDPADRIVYVHLSQHPAPPPAAASAPEDCQPLGAGYANGTLRARLGEPRALTGRPALIVLPGGGAAAEGPSTPAPALSLAR